MNRLEWGKYFTGLALAVAAKSKDESTKVGCVITTVDHEVLSTGYNGFPRNIKDTKERWERPLKYEFVVHAERNAIVNAARIGVKLKGSVCFVTAPPCFECAKEIIQAGITMVLWPDDNPFEKDPATRDRWVDSIQKSLKLLHEAGVSYFRL